MQTRAMILLSLVACSTTTAANAQDVIAEDAPRAQSAPEADTPPRADAPPDATIRPSRVDASAPLSGGERWVKDNGQWKLQRINYRYLDAPDYAPRPPAPPTIDDFPDTQLSGIVLSTRWFGGSRGASRWGWSATPVWGFGNGLYSYGGSYNSYGGSSWSWGASPWSPWGYGGWRGVPAYGWGNRGFGWGGRGLGRRGFGYRSGFGFSLGALGVGLRFGGRRGFGY